ncbi:secretory pathway Sec39 [Rhizodiscina lignyota]|uniref:Secretory pathway Sec39 n=1 Tax=Rhizodiscina lignyota TaxID=1504668 RepID=A0A9P4M8A0_9PEZI|nr:secretory pathway Sec39 [Rhizodiscina lignyota]
MDSVSSLTADHCILLAVQLARDSNVVALQNLTAARRDAFISETILRILLTYLPETLEPSLYTSYVHLVASGTFESHGDASPDISPVDDLSESQARKKAKKLQLVPLAHQSRQADESVNLLEQFLIHRAYRIDQESGLLTLIPQLIDPFLDTSEYLRTWFISTVIPLLRFNFEYYEQSESEMTLEAFDRLGGSAGLELLLSKAQEPVQEDMGAINHGSRDLRGLAGPWMYGSNERKRRRLNSAPRRMSVAAVAAQEARRIEEDAVKIEDVTTNHDWEYAFDWLVRAATHNFPFVKGTIEEWNGPSDIDLGGYEGPEQPLDPEVGRKLHIQYAQATFAAVYAVESDTMQTIGGAHSLLLRLATLMEYDPPPDLATSVEHLPRIDSQSSTLFETSPAALLHNVLLKPGHPLTTPNLETFSLLQMFVFSAYLLAGMGSSTSIVNIAKLHFQSNADEQFSMLQKILHVATHGPKKDDQQWEGVVSRLLWLWNWGFESEERPEYGAGILGKVHRPTVSKEILKTLLTAGCFGLVTRTYISAKHPTHGLSQQEIEDVITGCVLNFYDNASNGNRTRGGMKKAADIISAFKGSFPNSPAFRRCDALLAATHALSFYSLTLQHGVPFQPVNIRVSQDPLSLLHRVLEQNPQSYSKLDDLISIGQNLVSAGLMHPSTTSDNAPANDPPVEQTEMLKSKAERRVIDMAIEQALAEDDFETAYSYVVNRLNPSEVSPSTNGVDEETEDDLSWRAAFLAGRHRSATDLSSSRISTGSAQLRKPGLRRLEQRMELLSQALLLAPPSHLSEVLAAWRRCEEEMSALLAQESEEEQSFDDRADKRLPGAFGPSLSLSPVQTRREVGRGAVEEAPMGLFDVARGAAAAFSRSAFPLHGARTQAKPSENMDYRDPQRSLSGAGSDNGSVHSGTERVRKRDIVANAATNALTSGIGWVLGATPVNQ